MIETWNRFGKFRKILLICTISAVGILCVSTLMGPKPPPAPPIPTLGAPGVREPNWQNTNIRNICVEYSLALPEGTNANDIPKLVNVILTNLGMHVLQEGEQCDAKLTISLKGQALSAYYKGAGRDCPTGALLTGDISLTSDNQRLLIINILERKPPPESLPANRCIDAYVDPIISFWRLNLIQALAEFAS